MTKREIITALLAKRCPERMGLNEHFWPFLLENAWAAQGVADADWVKRFDLDIRGLFWCQVPGPRPDLEKLVEETKEWLVRRDSWGASFKYWKKKAGTPEHIAFTLDSPEAWRRDFREATLAIDMRQHINLEQARQEYAAAMAGGEFVTFNGLMLFEELRRILGDVSMLESLAAEPEFIHDFNAIITQKHIDFYAHLFREVGRPDGIHIFEDLGYTRGPFISPAMHRAMILPYHRRLFGLFKDFRLPIIFYTCGDFRMHLPSMIEAGVDCVQAMEAKTGMNVVELARQRPGQLCYMGNIDIRALESGDRARIKEEVLGKLNGMKALRAPYVFMSDHSIPPSVKLADYEYTLELYRANCRY